MGMIQGTGYRCAVCIRGNRVASDFFAVMMNGGVDHVTPCLFFFIGTRTRISCHVRIVLIQCSVGFGGGGGLSDEDSEGARAERRSG